MAASIKVTSRIIPHLNTKIAGASLDYLPAIPTPVQFKTRLEKTGAKYVGCLPAELSRIPSSTQEILGFFDRLAVSLRTLDCLFGERFGMGTHSIDIPKIKLTLGGQKIGLSAVGNGKIGHVYKLETGNTAYAFKVFNDPARIDTHGSWAETGFNQALNAAGTNNCIQLHIANPSVGWSIVEYGNEASIANKSGSISVEQFLKKHGFELTDNQESNRGPNGLVWDLGGIQPIAINAAKTLDDFQKLLHGTITRMNAGRRINELTSPTDRIKSLYHSLEYPDTRAQAIRGCYLLSEEERTNLLQRGLEYDESAGRAASKIYLAQDKDRMNLLVRALNISLARLDAVKSLFSLPEGQKLAGFKQAWTFPECRPMAAVFIPKMKNTSQRNLAKMMAGEDYGAKYVLLKMQERLGKHLSTHENEAKLEAFVNYFNSRGFSIELIS